MWTKFKNKLSKVNKFLLGLYSGFLIAFRMFTLPQLLYTIKDSDLTKINSILDIINNNYIESWTKEDILDGIYKGIFLNLDGYSNYLSKEEYEEFISSESNNFCGVGIRWQKNEDGIYELLRVYENGPAYESGLKKGDLIISVNEKNISAMSLEEVSTEIRGEEGTDVDIIAVRDNKELKFTVTRRFVHIPYAVCDIDNNLGIIKIESFEGEVVEDFRNALDKLDKENITNVIIDLRDNTGGSVDSLCDILSQIITEKKLVFTLRKNNNISEDCIIESYNDKKYNIVVLVNEHTASCSEIMAGMLQDYDMCIVVGEPTFGKGVIQDSFNMYDNSVVTLTTGRYYLPSGRSITESGLIPDIEIEDNIYTDIDEQLEKAKELF